MPDLFLTLIAATPKPSTAVPSVTIPGPAPQSGNVGGLYNELGQRQVQTPGSK